MTLQDNESYTVYSYTDLKAGQTLNITLAGTSANPESSGKKSNNLFAAGAAFLGFAVLGAGVWWWRRSDQVEQDQTNPSADQPTLNDVMNEIALLDETYEEKDLSLEQYQNQRKALLQKAKSLS